MSPHVCPTGHILTGSQSREEGSPQGEPEEVRGTMASGEPDSRGGSSGSATYGRCDPGPVTRPLWLPSLMRTRRIVNVKEGIWVLIHSYQMSTPSLINSGQTEHVGPERWGFGH